MFTGIIEEIGTIKTMQKGTKSIALTIQAQKVLEDIKLGDSVATNGVCLTVTSITHSTFTVDVMYETLNRSNMKDLKLNDRVNLERALTLNTRLGGHMVSGHIDGVGVIKDIRKEDIAHIYTIQVEQKLLKYMIEKGSIAIDGISLTLIEIGHDYFRISIIPHTKQETILSTKKERDSVNIEVDLIGKYIEKFTKSDKTNGLTMDQLKNYGYKEVKKWIQSRKH